jgi:Tol biopolymer transport system component
MNLAYVINLRGQVAIRIGQIDSGASIQFAPYADRSYKSIRFSPDGKSIYATIRDTNHPLYTLIRMSTLGGAPTEVVQAVDSQITFSPDGKSVAFIRREPDTGKNMILITDAETGKGERVLLARERPEQMFVNGISWSPDGTMIAFAGPGEGSRGSTLFVVRVSDGTVTKICSVENRIANLVWLPDQSGLILNRTSGNANNDGQIWRVSYPDGKLDNLSNDTLDYSTISLSVSADNKLVVVPSRSDAEIWVAPEMDISRARRLVAGSTARREGNAGLVRAPDGKILFTAKSGDGGKTIWEMDGSGEGQRQLTVSEKNSIDEQIAVTPDNRNIIFQSNRSGTYQVWRANRDGSDMKQVTSDDECEEPALSPDGTFIVYSRYTKDGPALWRIPVQGGEPIRLTDDAASWPAISPDGKFIACQWGRDVDYAKRGIAVLPIDGGTPIRFFSVALRAALYNRLIWSPDGRSILYKDETQGLWKQDIDKKNPEPIVGLEDFRFYHMASSGTDLIYSGGVIKRDIEIIEVQ